MQRSPWPFRLSFFSLSMLFALIAGSGIANGQQTPIIDPEVGKIGKELKSRPDWQQVVVDRPQRNAIDETAGYIKGKTVVDRGVPSASTATGPTADSTGQLKFSTPQIRLPTGAFPKIKLPRWLPQDLFSRGPQMPTVPPLEAGRRQLEAGVLDQTGDFDFGQTSPTLPILAGAAPVVAPPQVMQQTPITQDVSGIPSSNGLLTGPLDMTIYGPIPTWKFGANALYMTRLSPGSQPLVTRSGLPTFSANQFDFDYEPGYEVYTERRLESGRLLRIRFAALDGVKASNSHPYLAGDRLITTPGSLILANGTLTHSVSSEVMTGELMLAAPVNSRLNLSAGFRLLEYDEVYSADFVGTFGRSILTVDADNHLYGAQFGVDGRMINTDIFWVDGFLKGGIYGNKADQTTALVGPLDFTRASDTETASVVDLGVRGTLAITDGVAVNFGYSGLYMAGLAMGPDQVNKISSVPGGFDAASLDMSDTFYHGGFLGLEIRR